MKLLTPSIRAVPFERAAESGLAAQLLTQPQKQRLAEISTVISLPANVMLFAENSPADAVHIIARGVMKVFNDLPSGKQVVMAFLFPGDVVGLVEGTRYVNSVASVTPVILYRLPGAELRRLFQHDAELQFQFLCKLTHELRNAQRQIMVLTRRDATGRMAMFLHSLERDLNADAGRPGTVLPLPMSRTDIASYLGLSLEAVSRATSRLVKRGLIAFVDRHHVRILDRAALAHLASAL